MNIITKKGKVNKTYSMSVWNLLVQAVIDDLNGDIGTKEIHKIQDEFNCMLNAIVTKSREFK